MLIMYYLEYLSGNYQAGEFVGELSSYIPLAALIVAFSAGLIATLSFLFKRKAVVTVDVVLRKALASVLFIITAVCALIPNFMPVLRLEQLDLYSSQAVPVVMRGAFASALFVIVGLCFGMLGDIWLDLKYAHKEGEKRYLNAGFLSFLIGHLFYSLFMFIYYKPKFGWIAFLSGAVVVACFTAFTENLLKVKYGESKKITVIYMAVLGGTLSLAGDCMIESGFTVMSIIFFVGMVFFIASDALLAGIYFGNDEKTRTSRLGIVLNHSLYYTAQYLIAVSLFFAI